MKRPYDDSDERSIERHGEKLLQAGTLRKAPCAVPIPTSSLKAITGGKTRGSFGKLLEENYYGIKPGNSSAPDFPKAGVELKSTPLLSVGRLYKAKERLVLGIINYRDEAKKDFKESLLRKNAQLMLVSYEHKSDRPVVDHPVRIAQMIRYADLPLKDRLIIENDWEVIHKKIVSGNAQMISEGDTLYLAACTKGADGNSTTPQYASDVRAKTRAFSFKAPYMTALTRRILNPEETDLHEPVIRDPKTLKKKGLERTVEEKFAPFIGKTVQQIQKEVGKGLNTGTKDYLAQLARRMIGVQSKNIEEFENAGIVMKTVRIQPNGMPAEDMSFPYFRFNELIKERWDGDPDEGEARSELQKALEQKFLFVVFQINGNQMTLLKVFFWNMPMEDLMIARKGWLDTQKKVARSDLSGLIKLSDDKVIHVRPHGRNKEDAVKLPNGRLATKRCFWLNKSYIAKVIRSAR
ncbi:MAG: Sau3AI family type II restriction endonuclease [Minisyncoccota bacterium]